MKKMLLLLSLVMISSQAFASDDEDVASPVYPCATSAAESFAIKTFGFKNPKRVGRPFFSKKGNAVIVLIYDEGQSSSSAKHIALSVANAGDTSTCDFTNISAR